MSENIKVCAGIVLYNPDLVRLSENISRIITQVDKVILIDNGSKNIEEVKDKFEDNIKILFVCNHQNLGIAKALNQLVGVAKQNGFSWILTLDQDSVCMPELIKNYKKFMHLPKTGMLTCNIVDRNFGVESSVNQAEYETCKFCITSGSLLYIPILEKIGGFDEKLFIDKVDYDICLSMQEIGWKIVRVNYNGLLHEIGHAKKIKIGKSELVFFNHSSIRRYYIARNGIYCAKKHKTLNILKEFIIVVGDMVLVFVFEKNRIEKLKASIKGLVDGISMKVEK